MPVKIIPWNIAPLTPALLESSISMLGVSCQEIMKHTLAMDFIIFGKNVGLILEALMRIQKMLMHLSPTEFCAIRNSPQFS